MTRPGRKPRSSAERQAQDALLIELWNQGASASQIAVQLSEVGPTQSMAQVYTSITRLRRKGTSLAVRGRTIGAKRGAAATKQRRESSPHEDGRAKLEPIRTYQDEHGRTIKVYPARHAAGSYTSPLSTRFI